MGFAYGSETARAALEMRWLSVSQVLQMPVNTWQEQVKLKILRRSEKNS